MRLPLFVIQRKKRVHFFWLCLCVYFVGGGGLFSINERLQKMLRKYKRCNRFASRRPLTFSPFARSIALLHASKKLKHQHQNSEYKEKLTSKGQGSVKDAIFTNNAALPDSSSDEFEGLVQADFVFSDPKPCDFHGVKLLLQRYLDVKEWGLSGFVDLILGQTTVGSVVKIEDDDDDGVYGFITALSMGSTRRMIHYIVCGHSWLKGHILLVSLCHHEWLIFLLSFYHIFMTLFLTRSLGQQKTSNFAAPFNFLKPTEELRNCVCFKSFILVCKIYKGRDTHKTRERNRNSDGIIYTKPEDEIFHELSSCSFTFPLHNQQVTTNELRGYRLTGLVMVVDASKISSF